MLRCILTVFVACLMVSATVAGAEPAAQLAVFDVDATPPVGSPVAYALTRSVADPLHAKGIVLTPHGEKPIVVCVFDWIGIANGGQDWWRQELASAANTTIERVAVHTVHQHDGPRCDMASIALLGDSERVAPHFDREFIGRVRDDVVSALRSSISSARPVTHVGTGKGKVEKVASNRRLLGADGKVAQMRFSSSTNAEAIAAPEGVIDPYVWLVSFWDGEEALACMAYYASHPMSHYGKGDVSADFVGLARRQREKEAGVPHLYFTGAGGNVAAGKYNNGTPPVRAMLAERMAQGMQLAWNATVKTRLATGDVGWRSVDVALPVAPHLDAEDLRRVLENPDSTDNDRLAAASNLAWVQRCESGKQIPLHCLRLGEARMVYMPGELFVEYALAAQALCPDQFVCMAAYGDYGPGYIGTAVAYTQGGYESSPRASRVARSVEKTLLDALERLLK